MKRELRRRLGYVLEMMRESKTQRAVERLIELAHLLSQADAVWAQFCTEAVRTLDEPRREALRSPSQTEYRQAEHDDLLRELLRELSEELGVPLD